MNTLKISKGGGETIYKFHAILHVQTIYVKIRFNPDYKILNRKSILFLLTPNNALMTPYM
jgi:hypothetical protein